MWLSQMAVTGKEQLVLLDCGEVEMRSPGAQRAPPGVNSVGVERGISYSRKWGWIRGKAVHSPRGIASLGGGLRGGHPLLGDPGLHKGTEGAYRLAWRGWLLAASTGPRGERPGGRGSDLC